MSNNGYPVRVKALPYFVLIIRRQRSFNFQVPAADETIRPPGKNWVQAFYKRYPELKARRVKALDWNRHDKNIYDKVTHWFTLIGKELDDPTILPENVYNMDETGVLLSVLSSLKVLVGKEDLKSCRGAGIKRTLVTAIECISADGWHFACSKTGYTDSEISLYWIQHVFDPLTKSRANCKPRILINDGFATHESLEVMKFCFENNIILCRLPSHTSHKLQPCDVGVFGPLKTAYREQVEQLYRGGANTVGKEHFTFLYSRARSIAFTPRNIKSGWPKTGLYPFGPDRVLKDIQKPQAEKHLPEVGDTKMQPSPQCEFLRTPVTSEALTSLRSQLEHDICSLDGPGQFRFQKLANAAGKALAGCALLLDENRLLFEQNNESRSRQSTRSTVIGKAKVVSYEDIVEAQRNRDAKEAGMAGGSRRNSKRKSAASAPMPRKESWKRELEEAQVWSKHWEWGIIVRFCSFDHRLKSLCWQ